VLERIRFSGKRFLALMAKHASKIDRLRSEVAHLYKRLNGLKVLLSGYFGLSPEEQIPAEIAVSDRLIVHTHKRFFGLLKHIGKLKSGMDQLYKKIVGIKCTWFGYISNREVELAQKYKAAIVREDLDIVTIEKESPDYKGKAFNRMLNAGSQGQYVKISSNKLLWNGIHERVVPSYYTSTCCVRHGLVNRKMRQGGVFKCPECDEVRDADENASDTLGSYLLLRKKEEFVINPMPESTGMAFLGSVVPQGDRLLRSPHQIS
jgi:hypothetical protein